MKGHLGRRTAFLYVFFSGDLGRLSGRAMKEAAFFSVARMIFAGRRLLFFQGHRPSGTASTPQRRRWRLPGSAPLIFAPFLLLPFSAPFDADSKPSQVAPPEAATPRDREASTVLTAVACSPPEAPVPFPRSTDQHRASSGEFFPPVSTVSWAVDGLPELSGMSGTIASVLSSNAVRFRSQRGDFYAFLPGTLYGEVYSRDMATAAKMGQYLYSDAFLRGALEESLSQQLPTAPETSGGKPVFPGPGALFGMFAWDGRGEKTTAPSDEETSAIQLAYLYFSSGGGPEWLACRLNNETVLQRLNLAMERLLLGRQDPSTGLVKRAHTTDWGDIRFQGGSSPTNSDPGFEYWTASIYDQAWTYLALKQLTEMNRSLGQQTAAARWEQTMERLRTNTQRFLWQPERGYFRLHLHLTPLVHDFDEDNMVAIGNAVAVYAGLADQEQAPQIFDALEKARLQARATKPGLSLYPPYPQGFFSHSLVYEAGRYQNGGLWDWWGGVQITSEFESGYSALAWQHLQAVARDWSAHPNDVAEWQVPATNQMQGSGQYAGAAGTMGEAIVRGLFGVQLTRRGFALRPRLGEHSGHIHITQPASGHMLWVRHRAAEGALWMHYNTNYQQRGVFSALLPQGKDAETVLLDGVPQKFTVRTVGQDRYLDLQSIPPGSHALEVRLTTAQALPLSAVWESHSFSQVVPADQRVTAVVGFRNGGAAAWSKAGPHPIRVGYRWLDPQGQPPGGETIPEVHVDLPKDIRPGESASLQLQLQTPTKPGLYRLQVDLLQEYVLWFHQAAQQNRPLELAVRVARQPLAVEWLNVENPFTAIAGRETTFGLSFENVGLTSWRREAANPVRVGVRWYKDNGEEYRSEPGLEVRVLLPSDVHPGGVARIDPALRVPRVPGVYRVRFDMLQEPERLFGALDPSNRPVEVTVRVVS